MLFNTIYFILFFSFVFLFYWIILGKKRKYQNIFLLLASYFFYSCWDWRFLFLLLFSTLLDYFSGIRIEKSSDKKRKKWLWISICINLSFLGIFKYYNFFISSFSELLNQFGINYSPLLLNVILPVGISFYTFHGLSYVIDVYNQKIKTEKNFIDYGLFVSFFPLLVAGPIERASHLLPQIKKNRFFNHQKASDGLKQILWGWFKKVIIADQCAIIANDIFANYEDYNGGTLLIGAVCFAFQIYGDFSGYSDMALGTARMLGFELLKNFNYPYFSRNISEFWRKWHISLSSWFRDYLYIPLGGNRVSKWKIVRNTFITFIVSGFWHGANWTFIVWGGVNALFILPSILKSNTNKNIVTKENSILSLKEFLQIISTFLVTIIIWIFFRSETVFDAFSYINSMFCNFSWNLDYKINNSFVFLFLLFFIILEWRGRFFNYAIEKVSNHSWINYSFYYLLLIIIFVFAGEHQKFIYFQF